MTIGGIIFTAFLLILASGFIYFINLKFRYYKEDEREKLEPKKKSFDSPHENGHKLWMLNLKTLEMEQISQDYITLNGHDKDCLYCSALNEKNAIKHFSRMVPGRFEKLK